MKKRIISAVLLMSFILSAAACGGGSSDAPAPAQTQVAAPSGGETAVEETTAPGGLGRVRPAGKL